MIGVIVLYNFESIDVIPRSCEELGVEARQSNDFPTSLMSSKKAKLKTVCCEKYKKGKRCKRCPCFDLQ